MVHPGATIGQGDYNWIPFPLMGLFPSKYIRTSTNIACENILFSSLFVAEDVSRGGTPLSNDELLVLARGLTFCPTPKRINLAELSADINDFTRRMRLKEYFHDHNNSTQPNEHNPFHNKSSWTPPTDRDPALNTYVDAIKHDILTVNRNHITDNLTKDERQALRNLKKRQDIIIKPADKGSGTVVMDKSWYIDECNRQLNDAKFYRQLDRDITDSKRG